MDIYKEAAPRTLTVPPSSAKEHQEWCGVMEKECHIKIPHYRQALTCRIPLWGMARVREIQTNYTEAAYANSLLFL